MTWQGVPWAVGAWTVGGSSGVPQTPAEAARAVAYQAYNGDEGPAAGGDCAVKPLAVPGAGVRIAIGAVAVLNRSPGGAGQSYLCRQPAEEIVPITATGSGGGRTDLIAVVVQDPQYPGQPLPVSGANGPYVKTVVYTGVSSTVKKLSEVAPGQSGYALARVTLPASTGTVQAAHITDLRSLASPRTKVETKLYNIGTAADVVTSGSVYERFPQHPTWNIAVPSWGVKVHLELYCSGVRITNDATAAGDWRGKARVKLGSIVTSDVEINPPVPGANQGEAYTYIAAEEVAVPAAVRGTTQSLEAQALRSSSSSGMAVAQGTGTTVILKATFFEDVTTDAFTV